MNCMIIDDEEMSANMLKRLVNQVGSLRLKEICSCPMEALKFLKKEVIDLLFLDIEMPIMNGLELIRSLDKPPLVILTTSHPKYAVDAFEHDAIDYLMKPIELHHVHRAIEKAKIFYWQFHHKDGNFNHDFLFLRKKSLLNKVSLTDIQWIEAMGDYVRIQTPSTTYIQHTTLKMLEQKLPPNRFVRIHRSFIVQLDHIRTIDDNVIAIGNKLIPVGNLYKNEFLRHLNFL
jgi:two-component system LytT family response regulator